MNFKRLLIVLAISLISLFGASLFANPLSQIFHLLGRSKILPNGFLVMTSTSYTGNLGGLAGANAACLSELTSTNWKGKSPALVLDSTTVKALLCDSTTCQNPYPGPIYKAAYAGQSTIGGMDIYFDANGLGPYVYQSWDTTTSFDGTADNYWTGRSTFNQSDYGQIMEDRVMPDQPSSSTCTNWSSTSGTGTQGQDYTYASTVGSYRWSQTTGTCSSSKKLLCIVKAPDSFDFMPDALGFSDLSGLDISTTVTSTSVVTGITAPVQAIITSTNVYSPETWGAEIRNVTTASAWGSNVIVNNNDTIEVRTSSDPVYAATKLIRISVGERPHTWKVTTRNPNPVLGKMGYLVRTYSKYSGNLGGLTGANQICLVEASDRWRFKGNYPVSAANVKAFLCDGSTCNNLDPNTKYATDVFGYSMRAYSNPLGGGVLYSNASGLGPNSTGSWYPGLGTSDGYVFPFYDFWTGRAAGSATLWSASSTTSHCSAWTNDTSSSTGTYGNTQSTSGTSRWSLANGPCNTPRYLVCIINPPASGIGFTDVRNATVNTIYTDSWTANGLTGPINVTVTSGGAQVRKNAGAWSSSVSSLANGDILDIRMTSSPLKSGVRISQISAGEINLDWSIRNTDTPTDEVIIPRSSSALVINKMASSGNTMGAYTSDGKIQIYQKSGSTWAFVEALTVGTSIASFSISDTTLVVGYKASYVGLYPDGGNYTLGGYVIVYEKGATWAASTQSTLLPPTAANYTYFGLSVAQQGTAIVVSTALNKAYVFENTGGGWGAASVSTLAIDSVYDSYASDSVEIKGNTIAIGIPRVNLAGLLNVFVDTGSGWGSATKYTITTSNGLLNDYFGGSVDISSDESTIVVGAAYMRHNLSYGTLGEAGLVYIYEKGATWASATETILQSPRAHTAGGFGYSVEIQNNLIAVSAHRELGEGAIYLYKKTTSWAQASRDVLMKRLSAGQNTGVFDLYGGAMNLCGDHLVVRAGASPLNTPTGSIFNYDISTLTGGGAICE